MNTARRWERRELYQFSDGTNWTRPVNREGKFATDDWLAFVCGRRNDGKRFAVSVSAPSEELGDESRRARLLEEKFSLLDTFLDPRCACEGQNVCAWHRTVLPGG